MYYDRLSCCAEEHSIPILIGPSRANMTYLYQITPQRSFQSGGDDLEYDEFLDHTYTKEEMEKIKAANEKKDKSTRPASAFGTILGGEKEKLLDNLLYFGGAVSDTVEYARKAAAFLVLFPDHSKFLESRFKVAFGDDLNAAFDRLCFGDEVSEINDDQRKDVASLVLLLEHNNPKELTDKGLALYGELINPSKITPDMPLRKKCEGFYAEMAAEVSKLYYENYEKGKQPELDSIRAKTYIGADYGIKKGLFKYFLNDGRFLTTGPGGKIFTDEEANRMEGVAKDLGLGFERHPTYVEISSGANKDTFIVNSGSGREVQYVESDYKDAVKFMEVLIPYLKNPSFGGKSREDIIGRVNEDGGEYAKMLNLFLDYEGYILFNTDPKINPKAITDQNVIERIAKMEEYLGSYPYNLENETGSLLTDIKAAKAREEAKTREGASKVREEDEARREAAREEAKLINQALVVRAEEIIKEREFEEAKEAMNILLKQCTNSRGYFIQDITFEHYVGRFKNCETLLLSNEDTRKLAEELREKLNRKDEPVRWNPLDMLTWKPSSVATEEEESVQKGVLCMKKLKEFFDKPSKVRGIEYRQYVQGFNEHKEALLGNQDTHELAEKLIKHIDLEAQNQIARGEPEGYNSMLHLRDNWLQRPDKLGTMEDEDFQRDLKSFNKNYQNLSKNPDPHISGSAISLKLWLKEFFKEEKEEEKRIKKSGKTGAVDELQESVQDMTYEDLGNITPNFTPTPTPVGDRSVNTKSTPEVC